MSERIKYEAINFSEYVYACPTSRTGLRWKNDRFAVREDGTLGKQVTVAGDQAGSDHGEYWCVGINGDKYMAHRVVYILANGGIDGKLDVDHRDGNGHNNLPYNLRAVTKAVNARNARKKTGKRQGVSGVNGVTRQTTHGGKYAYWRAATLPLDGSKKKHVKLFSIAAYGDAEAFNLACDYRARCVADLNKQGAGYSERHGI